jgi:hybrid cluster-associated redox disulfide protein
MDSTQPDSITADTTIDTVVTRHPVTARVFINRRMHCVGCEIDRFHTVAEACRIYGQPLTSSLAELRDVAGTSRATARTRADRHAVI